ncbi:MAG TPA: hypothetical protein VN203_27295, partial [Candidatus Acidoferrum sp.]|nr:hypothetical protein [Candidatus Acidoferrum sp.]
MTERYEVLLKNGMVVDPATGRQGILDVAVAGGKIAHVTPDIDPTRAEELFDVRGYHVVPGVIDLHMHASSWLGGKWAQKMMAEVGVTTALDMSGPVDSVMNIAREHGVGVNIACIQSIRPGHTVRDTNPCRQELHTAVETALQQGAIGIKLLGGHYPLTPDATASAIEVANRHQAYIAFHAGTLEKGSNIDGFLQAAELAGGHAIHMAHINSYCRGATRPYMQETEEAIAALEQHPNIRSESYLSPLNGTSAKCAARVPESRVTRHCLETGGFAPTEAGLEEAI